MSRSNQASRLISRLCANLVAVAAISAIFGLKTHMDAQTRHDAAERLAARHAAITLYEPYLTEQP